LIPPNIFTPEGWWSYQANNGQGIYQMAFSTVKEKVGDGFKDLKEPEADRPF
jgi:hypothetical protein